MMENTNQSSTELQRSQKVKKLQEVLEAHKGETHILAIQDYPDPVRTPYATFLNRSHRRERSSGSGRKSSFLGIANRILCKPCKP